MGWENKKKKKKGISKQKQPRATWMCLAEWCPILPMEVPMLPGTVLLIYFHRDRGVVLGFKAPFLSDHRKLST